MSSIAILAFLVLLALQFYLLRKRELAAKSAKAEFSAAAEASLNALFILKSIRGANDQIEDFEFADINDSGTKLLDLPKQRVIGESLNRLLPESRRDGLFDKYAQVAQSGASLEEEFEVRTPEFKARWLRHQIVRLGDGVAVTMRDISERKGIELELRTRQAELVAVNDASPLGLFHTDPDGACTYVNRTYEAMSGLTAAQALGDGWVNSIHPEDRLKVFQGWGKSSKTRQPYQGIYRFRHPDGRIVWVSMKTAPILVDGKTQGYVGTVDDITARREVEQALSKSEQRLRTITDTLPALVAYVDADQRYRFVNLAFERSFKLGRDAISKKTMCELLGEAEYDIVKPYVERVLQGESVIFENEEGIDDADDDPYRCSESTYIPQFAEDGREVVGFHVMVQDITAKKIEEKRLLQLTQVDSLTGLVNRAGFEQKLAAAMAHAKAEHALMAIMYLDVDHFKSINDTLGHLVGDMLLKAFASRLSRTLRSVDTVARLGGDEFTVIMEDIAKIEDVENIAAKIVKSMRALFSLEGHPVSASVSIGVAFYQGSSIDAKKLIRHADEMLYLAKAQGRNTYSIAPFEKS